MPRQRRIGLTGGIASGKSSVGHWLTSQGIPVLDADLYAQEALAPDTEASRAVLNRYGNTVSTQSNNNRIEAINRSALASIVFANKKERDWLEKLIHPLVRHRFETALEEMENGITVALMIPLLFEAGFKELCSEVWVVNCTLDQQRNRLMARNHLTAKEAEQRIQSQWSLEKKCKLADQVINNTSLPGAWKQNAYNLLQKNNNKPRP
jgi:dephospho-CoA kinase